MFPQSAQTHNWERKPGGTSSPEPNTCYCDECAAAEERILKHSQEQLVKQQKKYKIIEGQLDPVLNPQEHSQDLRFRNCLQFLIRDIADGLRITEDKLDQLTLHLNNDSNFKTHAEAQNSRRLRAALNPPTRGGFQRPGTPRPQRPAFQRGVFTRPPRVPGGSSSGPVTPLRRY